MTTHKSFNVIKNIFVAIKGNIIRFLYDTKSKIKYYIDIFTTKDLFFDWIVNNWQKWIFIFLWILINIALWIEAVIRYRNRLTALEFVGTFRGGHTGILNPFWVMMARGFGQLLNFNCALLLPMVTRTILTILQDLKLGVIIPFHKNIVFHRYIAYWVMICGLLHGAAHYFNYACCTFQYFIEDSGATPLDGITRVVLPERMLDYEPNPVTTAWWGGAGDVGWQNWLRSTKYGFTGNVLWIIMTIMFSASNKSYRRSSNFTVFWFLHHLFIFFFVLLLVHGKNFWMWFLGPGTLYLLERVLRNLRGSALTIVKRVHYLKGNIFVLVLDKPSMKYKAGQYAFVNVPMITPHEWHPFTISSSPKDPYLTFHIRVAGDWTGALRDSFNPERLPTLEVNAPVGADGKSCLVRVDGPFGTEADFIFNFKVVMLVACGVGVTPYSSILSELRHRIKEKKGTKVKKCFFYWMNRGGEGWSWFGDLLAECEDNHPEIFDIRTFVTGDISKETIEKTIFTSEEYLANRRATLKLKDQERFKIDLKAIAMYNFDAEDQSQISLQEGDSIIVQTQSDEGWWTGTNERTGQKGMFPGNYVKIADETTQLKNSRNRQFGRPNWKQEFELVRKYVVENFPDIKKRKTPFKVGIFLCGPPVVGNALQSQARRSSKRDKDGNKIAFSFHKENF